MLFASSDVNWTSVKVSLQQWDLPLTINILLNGCEWKKLRRKNDCSRYYWQKLKSWWVKTLIKKYQCEIFNFVDLCSGVGMVWSTTTRTRVSDATAVTFSVKCFNPWKRYHLSGNVFRKWFASYFLFIHEHLIITWSPTVNLITVTTLLLTSLLAKNM